jgi:hypothetical protein
MEGEREQAVEESRSRRENADLETVQPKMCLGQRQQNHRPVFGAI